MVNERVYAVSAGGVTTFVKATNRASALAAVVRPLYTVRPATALEVLESMGQQRTEGGGDAKETV